MMWFKSTVALICFSVNFFAQSNGYISNEQLTSSGIKRISGIYSLMNEWDSFTFDGYRWYTSFNGLSSLQNQNWILMLDGQRMDIDFFNLKNINTLPITVNHVDSIETVNQPKILKSEFTVNGLINIKTLKPKTGLTVTGRYAAGNETGDPGPYFYTGARSSNVEEDGPNLSASVEYGSEQIWGRLFFYTESYSATDTTMRKRNPQLGWQDFKGRKFSPSLQMGFNALNGTHNLFLGYSSSEIQPFHPRTYTSNDLVFIAPAIKDYPVQKIFKHAGLNGDFNLSRFSKIYYTIKISSNKLYGANNKLINFDHKQTNYYSNLQFYNKGIINFFIGTGFNHTKLSASYSSREQRISLFKTYGGIDFNPLKNMISRAGIEFLFSKNKTALKGYVNSRWYQSNKLWIDLNLAVAQTLPEEKNDLWYWIENGYDVLNNLDVDYFFIGERKKELKFTADLNTYFKLNRSLVVCSGMIFRNLSNYFIENTIGVYYQENSSFNSFTTTNTSSYGSVAGFSLKIKNEILYTLSHSLEYRFITSVNGDSLFKNEWLSIPQHKLTYNVIFIPFESFSLWVNLIYLSEANWNDYPNLKELSDGFYSSDLDERIILDISIRKWFWNNRLRFNLLFKNLLNTELKYHPLGANFNLSVFFSAEFVFNTIIE